MSGADLTRPLSDNQFEQLYHAVLRHQVVFLREQNITPAQQRDLGAAVWRPAYPSSLPSRLGVEENYRPDTHNDNPPDNDNWHTDVTFIDTPPAGAILAAKELQNDRRGHPGTSGIATGKRCQNLSGSC
ncbi:TauD/TfdA family dioxygenase [Klebsiella pneumoniae]|uniref:TauD/TfdA family dioxygenase n=1 Tax=Klebsiella pneumoniae TaxID=573 RepID=A0A939NM28_KLEPN|nr:TauD/TfdA family dioxygenase [Klebsiella pneumoniae]